MSVRKQAEKQERQLRGVERLGKPVTDALMKTFERNAVRALKNNGRLSISETDKESLVQELADLMALAYLRRYRTERTSAGVSLSLSFGDQIRRLARAFDLNPGAIRNQFLSFIRPKVDDALGDVQTRINRELSIITARQRPTRLAVRDLRRAFNRMGLTPSNPAMAETLVRTHSQLAFAAGQYQLDQDDPDDIIWGYTYSTVGDDRVRPSHAILDGLTRPKNDPIWRRLWVPNGFNCRCQIISLTAPEDITPIPPGASPDPGFEFDISAIAGMAA